ncbi:angiotensin-converting enzyme-like isoform X2 [Macrosteles quadrilineatus]|uniref:angiotensin-converting enzyme-like isoform X1 n=1 Tax=Macrosteles quadrilineatus TaxID=74068 RepID=UPI0023E2F300|nr:angiotensin-converting enzyme-like isoform X1 [Macrosteles quadrilineatus]XP_054261111.1 angiotensin-converting enzyme-like isoform X2 [Macrosteles quadrilineatus]
MRLICLLVLVAELRRVTSQDSTKQYTEEEGRKYINEIQESDSIWANKLANAGWDYNSNLTDYNLDKQMKLSAEYAVIERKQWEEVIKYDWKSFKDPSLKRMFKLYSKLGTAALPEEERSRLEKVVADMSNTYATAKLREWPGPGRGNQNKPENLTISLEPDLVKIFKDVNSPCKLQYYWEGWHTSVGRQVKDQFKEYVDLSNKAAKLNDYPDNAASWNEDFEMDDFDGEIKRLYNQILPLYKELHAYVRRKLMKRYNTAQHKLIEKHGCLPAHILGNLWGQEWQDTSKLTIPYKGKSSVDVTANMVAQKYTPLKMYKMAEEFFTSINMSAMTDTFWKKSIIEKPTDRDMVCHASAWDFSNGDDFRIKMCTEVNFNDLKTVHHEMGHIEYYQQYKDQKFVFQQGANSGFHEAVGDTITLSVSTPEHLMKVGLLDSKTYKEDKKSEMNALFLMALEKVAFLPFAMVLDLWRWEIFRGKVTPDQYNCRYWQLRQELQGIVPPVDRSKEDFDAGAKYHVIADVPYIRYFVSFVIQFQFHEALCIKAGQYDPNNPSTKPLHHCDIYQSKEAGNIFKKMLAMGGSKPPQDAFEVLTGQRDMDAGALLRYFAPLHKWLEEENKRAGVKVGWSTDHKIKCNGDGEVKARPANPNCRYDFT